MLSTKNIKSSDDAKHYFFEQDNYYTKDSDEAKKTSSWAGKGAASLGLSGAVDKELFQSLLEGKLPNGQQLGKKEEGIIHHRPGFDLTFSAPKSVSILAEIGRDERIYKAHEKAVEVALSYIERSCAQARVGKNGKIVFESTANLVAALFRHDTSRELDPSLHTHAVTMNVTQRLDGKWRSLASDLFGYSSGVNGFIERVNQNKIYFGSIYRSTLAHELTKMGYEIIKTHDDCRFEVSGVPQEVIEHFSKRSKSIKQLMSEKGWFGAKAAAYATLETRDRKLEANRETLHRDWKEQSKNLGFDVEQFVENTIAGKHQHKDSFDKSIQFINSMTADKAVDLAIRHLSERDVNLSHHTLINMALSQAIGSVSPSHVMDAINRHLKEGRLLKVNSEIEETYYTTRRLVGLEQNILKRVADGQYAVMPLLTADKSNSLMQDNSTLSDAQKQIITEYFEGHDRYTMLSGKSGSGKSHVMSAIAHMAHENKCVVVCLTPTLAQSRSWKVSPHINVNTVNAFISDSEERGGIMSLFTRKQRLVLVDNAHLLPLSEVHDLTAIAECYNARVLLSGDRGSYQSPGAGSAFDQLIKSGIRNLALNESNRKINATSQLALLDVEEGQFRAAVSKLDRDIIEIESADARVSAMAERYAEINLKERKDVLVLMSTKKECLQFNQVIREHLKNNNLLGSEEIKLMTYIPQPLTKAQLESVKNYQVGWFIRFNEGYFNARSSKGEYRKIAAINKNDNSVELVYKGKTIKWRLPKNHSPKIELFAESDCSVRVGEKLQVLRSDRLKGVSSSDILRVKSMDEKCIKTVNSAGTEIEINRSLIADLHIDHAYAMTPYRAHHFLVSTLIAYHPSQHSSTNQRVFYKALSQAEDRLIIYTDNKEQYANQLQRCTGEKLSAIDSLLNQKRERDQLSVIPKTSTQEYVKRLMENINEAIQDHSKHYADDFIKTSEAMVEEGVKFALAKISEREAAFTHKELMEIAVRHTLGKHSPDIIEKAIGSLRDQGEIIKGLTDPSEGTLWTTKESIGIEEKVVSIVKNGKNQVPALLDKDVASAMINHSTLSPDKKIAAEALLTTTDRFVLLQAPAGTGKTTTMNRLQAIVLSNVQVLAGTEGYEFKGIAPSHTAVDELNKNGIVSQTLQSFLIEVDRENKKEIKPVLDKTIYILDEASMVSNQDSLDLVKFIESRSSRLILVGDHEQILSPQAGKIYEVLQRSGVRTLYLTENHRQALDKIALRSAIKHIMNKDFKSAFMALNEQGNDIKQGLESSSSAYQNQLPVPNQPAVIEIEDRTMRLAAMVDHYFSKDPEKRKNILVVIPYNKDRVGFNEMAQEARLKLGEISETAQKTFILKSRNLSKVEMSSALYYKMNDIIRFNSSVRSLGIKRSSYLSVTAIDVQHNILTLKGEGDMPIYWQIPPHTKMKIGYIEVYEQESRNLHVGDVIRWTRSDKRDGLVGGSSATVVESSLTEAKFMLDKGIIKTINLSDPKYAHWDHAYAITANASQGKGEAEVLGHQVSSLGKVTNQRGFYVTVTRAKQQATLYVDNREKVIKKLYKTPGNKWSALEVTGQLSEAGSLKIPSHEIDKKESQLVVKQTKTIKANWDANEISLRLHEQLEQVLKKTLGEPKRKSGKEWRYGANKGSLVVTLSGDDRGLWYDFQSAKGGNALKLLAEHFGHTQEDFSKTLESAAALLGMSKQSYSAQPTAKKKCKGSEIKKQGLETEIFTNDQLKSIQRAQFLVKESMPIDGTLAERYLREHRAIQGPLPKELRFHPSAYSSKEEGRLPALMVIGKNEKGEVQSVQLTYLDSLTANKANVEVKKRGFGVIKGSVVNLSYHNEKAQETLICEGVETGLSIKEVYPNKSIMVTFGIQNFTNFPLNQAGEKIIFCLDNDGNNKGSDELIEKACDRIVASGKTAYINKPDEYKKDYNDVLKIYGKEAIYSYIENSKEYSNSLAESALSGKKATVNEFSGDNKFVEQSRALKVKMGNDKEIDLTVKKINPSKDEIDF